MTEATTPSPPPSRSERLARLEPYFRNSLLAIIVATALPLVGQYTGASAVASALQRDRWRPGPPAAPRMRLLWPGTWPATSRSRSQRRRPASTS